VAAMHNIKALSLESLLSSDWCRLRSRDFISSTHLSRTREALQWTKRQILWTPVLWPAYKRKWKKI